MRKSPTFVGSMACQRCGRAVPRVNAMQKYCIDCSLKADRERKAKWARLHPQPYSDLKPRRKRRESIQKDRALSLNKTFVWPDERGDVHWITSLSVPFTYALSKNHIWKMSALGHREQRAEANEARAALVSAVRQALGTGRVLQGKLWIQILVQKPDNRGDAVNFVSAICDAIKEAINLDDRWYCLYSLDWQIAKREPRIFLAIGQSVAEDQQVCSWCGRIMPARLFLRGRRECPDCRKGSHGSKADAIEKGSV